MKQVVVTRTCDPCASWKGREVEEGVETVVVAGGQTLDLCPEHRDGMRRFLTLLAEFGESPEPAPGKRKVKGASTPSKAPAELARRSAVNGVAAHVMTTAEVADRLGIGKRRVRQLVEEGALHPVDGPRTRPVYFPAEEVAEVETRRNRRGGARARARRANASPPVARVVEVVEGDPANECPLCTRRSPTTAALTMHLRERHGTTLTELYGRVCPLCEAECVTTGALGVHGSTSHGIERGGGVVALFARARDEGDPHDVIASRARALVEAASA